jgi:hypothetical protein
VRRPVTLLAIAALALPLAACGATPSAEQQRRADFLMKYDTLDDQELARLCPALFPKDFLSTSDPDGADKYKYKADKSPHVPTEAERADARAHGCGSGPEDGTVPRKNP